MLDRYLKVLPQHIKDSNSELILFLKAYYQWLENNKIIFEYVAKEQRTSLDDSEFLDYLKAEILAGFPTIVVDESLLLKHIKEYYVSKGTEESIKFLLKITLGVDSSILYPADYLFTPSAATWVREFALRFNLTTGEITSTIDVPLTITSLDRTVKVNAKVIAPVQNDTYEVTLPKDLKLAANTTFTITGDTFTGTLIKTITKKTIRSRGRGFKIGDIFEVNTSGGSGTKIKVTRVSDTGIRAFDIIQFGQGYLTNFEHSISPNIATNVTENRNFTVTNDGIPTQYTSPDNVDKLVDTYQISKFTYLQSTDYLENNTYVGSLEVAGQSEVTGSQLETSEDSAVVFFELGYVFAYPGYYLTNEGMPSDVSRLQDGEYWQQFSYVIKSEKQYSDYQAAVKQLVHPAGLRMFGEYNIDKRIELTIAMKTYLDVLQSAITESFNTTAEVDRKELIKNIIYYPALGVNTVDTLGSVTDEVAGASYESFSLLEAIAVTLTKDTIVESPTVSEQVISNFSKNIAELTSLVEDLQLQTQKLLTDNVLPWEVISSTFTKDLKDRVEYLIDQDYSVDTLFTGGEPFGTGSDIFGTIDNQDTPDQVAVGSGFDLNVGDNYTLSTAISNTLLVDNVDELLSDEEIPTSSTVYDMGGVVLNPYYSIADLLNNNNPYWQFGYTVNERIMQQ